MTNLGVKFVGRLSPLKARQLIVKALENEVPILYLVVDILPCQWSRGGRDAEGRVGRSRGCCGSLRG